MWVDRVQGPNPRLLLGEGETNRSPWSDAVSLAMVRHVDRPASLDVESDNTTYVVYIHCAVAQIRCNVAMIH